MSYTPFRTRKNIIRREREQLHNVLNINEYEHFLT